MKKYILNILIWLDIGLNVFIFSGSPYETISSRVGKRAVKGERWACIFCKILDKLLGRMHCKISEVSDYDKTFNWWK